MRYALLSFTERPGNAVRVTGASVLERQVDIALALKCEVVLLHADGPDEVSLRAQRLAERGGAGFRFLPRGEQLLAMVRSADEVLVLGEGLYVDDRRALAMIDERPSIVTCDIDAECAFERLDADRAWAGALLVPGDVVARLDALSHAFDPVSALLRAGRTSELHECPLPADFCGGDCWRRVRSDQWHLDPRGGENATLLERHVLLPLLLLALRHDRSGWVSAIGAGLSTLATLASTYAQRPAIALAFLSFAILAFRVWRRLLRARDPRRFSGKPVARFRTLPAFSLDIVGACILAFGLSLADYAPEAAIYVAIVTLLSWSCGKDRSAGQGSRRRDTEPLWLALALSGAAGFWFAGAAAATALGLVRFMTGNDGFEQTAVSITRA